MADLGTNLEFGPGKPLGGSVPTDHPFDRMQGVPACTSKAVPARPQAVDAA